MQIKRNLVITFGGGVNEVMRQLIATAGLEASPRSEIGNKSCQIPFSLLPSGFERLASSRRP